LSAVRRAKEMRKSVIWKENEMVRKMRKEYVEVAPR
jgi:hypothetical protein